MRSTQSLDLASNAEIGAALARLAERNRSSTEPRRPTEARLARSSAGSRRKNCKCGCCRTCLDNVRWERIFNEKFADPGYYKRLHVRYSSSLADGR